MNTVNPPLLAPNGNPSKLTPEQWELVRTPEFKEWFGDWEKEYRIEKLWMSKPIEITGEEYKGKYELNRDSAKTYIKDNLRGEYIIDDTKEAVSVNRKSINKVTSHSMGNDIHLKSLVVIPTLLHNSIFISEEKAEKQNSQYDNYRYYVTGLKIENIDYTAKLTIGVDENGNKFYDHALTQIEKTKLIDYLNQSAFGFISTEAEPNPSVTEYKDTKLLSILQTNITKTLDINAEPKKEDITEYITINTKLNSNKTKVMKTKEEQYQADLAAVKKYDFALKYIKEQTPELCLAAVKNHYHALKYIWEQTHEICMAAIKEHGGALQYVKEQTPELCLEAVKKHGYALEYVKEQTPEICWTAVKQEGNALEYVKEQTLEICLAAVKQHGWAIEYVKEQTPELCMAAVKQHGYAVKYVKEQTPELCLEAIKRGYSKDISPQFQPLFEPLTIGDRELSLEERYTLRTTKTLDLKDVLDKKGNKRDVVVKIDNEGKIKIYPPISISQKQENKQTTKNGMKF